MRYDWKAGYNGADDLRRANGTFQGLPLEERKTLGRLHRNFCVFPKPHRPIQSEWRWARFAKCAALDKIWFHGIEAMGDDKLLAVRNSNRPTHERLKRDRQVQFNLAVESLGMTEPTTHVSFTTGPWGVPKIKCPKAREIEAEVPRDWLSQTKAVGGPVIDNGEAAPFLILSAKPLVTHEENGELLRAVSEVVVTRITADQTHLTKPQTLYLSQWKVLTGYVDGKDEFFFAGPVKMHSSFHKTEGEAMRHPSPEAADFYRQQLAERNAIADERESDPGFAADMDELACAAEDLEPTRDLSAKLALLTQNAETQQARDRARAA